MKAKHIILPAVLAVFGLTSCVNDLDVTPIDPSTNMEVDPNALFNKCYATMALAGNGGADGDCDIDGLDGGFTGFVRQIVNSQTLTTDEAMCCWGDEGISTFNFNNWGASHPMLNGLYYRLYFGVTMTNYYLSECGGVDATKTAEVRFLRALHYYYLMDGWGNVPFLTEMSSEKAPQGTREQVFNFIESELLDCVNDMSEAKAKKSTDSGYGRADKAAAWLLLSRLYLNSEVYTGKAQYEKAAEYAKKVMDSSYKLNTTKMGQWSAYQMLFMGDNGETDAAYEAVLPLLQDGITTTSWGTSLFLIASTFKDDMKLVGEDSNNTTQNWGGNRCRPDLVLKFFPNNNVPKSATSWEMVSAAGDDRALFWSKDRKFDVEDPSDFTNGLSTTKFTNFYATGGKAHDVKFPDTDWFFMRAAEAYLNYAEAKARMNNGTADADGLAALNAIRTRANAQPLQAASLDVICDEWTREFYFEGYRRTVLIRFGKFGGNTGYTWQWKGGTITGANFAESLNVFAIPETDLNANPNLKQNPGY
ncbi:MAG: RagB/SusD family nutrient uptake outer membrane protein [Bacteroidales bacterium]|nr:RagB/SusD family nutrient uptake outer membrane protein [Bacteroidales bacterium]